MTALSAVLFGLLGFLAKTVAGCGFSYEAILGFRFATAAFVIGLAPKARGRKLALPAPVLVELALVGIAGYAATSLALFAEGVRRVGPTSAAVLSTLEPTVSVLAGVAILGERPSGVLLVPGSSVLVALPGRRP